jgi:hypothetical protein
MPQLDGDVAKMRINSRVFAFATVTAREEPVIKDTSDSEHETFGRSKAVKKRLFVSAQMVSFDPDLNLFAGPMNLRVGAVVDLKIYPNGLDDPNIYWSPTFEIQDLTHEMQAADGLQPVSFQGRSNDEYLLPGDLPP